MINSATFVKDIVLFLRTYIRGAVSDPLTGRTGDYVFTSYPKSSVQYPIITIRNTNINVKRLGMQVTNAWSTVKVECRVWARSTAERDDLTQKIIIALNDSQFLSNGTVQYQILDFRVDSAIDPPPEELNDITVHSKIINISYNVILT